MMKIPTMKFQDIGILKPMKYLLQLFILFLFTTNIYSQQKAFPTAEGFGKYAQGGRAGQVIKVTNLNDSGPGSFRAACEASGPRTVIFEVGGRIELTSGGINITNDNITIAGQTAPGDGIMITAETSQPNQMFVINADDVIVRYMTFRRSSTSTGSNSGDCIYISTGNNIIFDHVSTSWSSDGNLDIADYSGGGGSNLDNVTVQYTLSGHSYDKHSLHSGKPSRVTYYRNAYINVHSRAPAMSSTGDQYGIDGEFEVANCIMYDYGSASSIAGRDSTAEFRLNYMNNEGSRQNGQNIAHRMLNFKESSCYEKVYVKDNINGANKPNSQSGNDWDVAQMGTGNEVPECKRVYTPHQFPLITDNVTLWDAEDLDTNLIPVVGNYLFRDAEDQRCIDDYINGTSTPSDNNTFPIYNNGTPQPDVDDDGMPDSWEFSVFGNMDNDGTGDYNGDGYTDLEDYLNDLAGSSIEVVNGQSVTISPAEATINVPETIQLTKSFIPANTTDQTGVWSSSDESVATVDSNGLVTSVEEGVAIITFTANDGGISDSSTITVTNIVIPVTAVTISPTDITLDINESEQLTTNFDGFLLLLTLC